MEDVQNNNSPVPDPVPQQQVSEFNQKQPMPQFEHQEPVTKQESPAKAKFELLDFRKAGIPPFLLIGFVIIGFIAAALIFTYFSKAKKPQPKSPKASAAVSKSTAPVTLVEVAPLPNAASSAQSSAQQDKPIPSFVLSGILFGEDGSLALINGRVVREGAMVEGAKLEKVSADRVELSFEGQKITLRSK